MKINFPLPSFAFSLGLLATAATVSAQDFSLKLDPDGAARHFSSGAIRRLEALPAKPARVWIG